MKTSLQRACGNVLLILSIVLKAVAVSVTHSATVTFDGASDLNTNFTHAKTTPIQVTHAATSGIGGSGAIRLRNTANSDAGFAAVYSPLTFDATGNRNVWTASIVFDSKSIGGNPAPFVANEKERLKVSLGFSGTNNLSNPVKFFDKKNTNSSATFRAQMCVEADLQVEHKSGSQGRLRLRLRSIHAWDQETQGPQEEISIPFPGPYTSIASWFRLDFRLELLGNDEFVLTAALYDLGSDGTANPQEPVRQTSLTVSNAAFASLSTVYAAFSAEVEKKAAHHKVFHVDNFSVSTQAIVPEAPTALEATNVLTNAAIANWEAPTTGARVGGYVVELTKAADNFAPNTFLDANGNTGQASGIVVSNPGTTSQVLSGLLEGTAYVYRIRAINRAGASVPSAVKSFTTQQAYVNAPPTLNALGDIGPLWPNNPTVTVQLTGISQGLGDTGQTLTVSATSSNPAVVAHPTVNYTSPNATGTLVLTPAGGEGTVTITVTVDDGQTANNTITRTFSVTIRTPPAEVDFDEETSVAQEFLTPNTQNGVLLFGPEVGSGNPPTGGIYFKGLGSNDNGIVLLRRQPYFMSPLPSVLRNSILINGRELAQDPSGSNKHQAEVELGFRNQITPFDSKAKDFFAKGGTTNRSVSVRLQFQHEPAKGNVHHVRARLRNYVGNSINGQTSELTASGLELFQNWLSLTFEVVPLSTSEMSLVYQVHKLGPDGLDQPELVLEDSITVTNPGFLTAPAVYAGFVLSTEKNMLNRGIYVDTHRVNVLYTTPGAPTGLEAVNVTSQNALLRWQRGEGGAVPFGYILELSADPSFPAHSFIAANGTPGQSTGITLNSPTAKSQQITGLQPGSTYYFRVRGANGIGESGNSAVMSFTTLAAGVNAPPTLSPIPDLTLTVGSGPQTVVLRGITDGGELNQSVMLTATTSDPNLVQGLQTFYNPPLSTGELVFTPALNVTGSATITVTADDGGPNPNTISRTFTVSVINVEPVIPFDSVAQLDGLTRHVQDAGLVHLPNGGVGPVPGMVAFTRSATGSEKGAMVLRPYAYDARAVGYWVSSLFVRASDIGNITSGKDKVDLRLGFVATDQPATPLKDTFHKVQSGMGMRLKLEHEPGSGGKEWLLEAEAYSTAPQVGGGFNETKGAKQTLQSAAAFSHWLKVSVQAVRRSASQYEIRYLVEDWGLDGAARVATLLNGPAFTVTNASFANDASVYAGFLIGAERNQGGTLFFDNHEVMANTKAPDAPSLLPAFDITAGGFTIAWNPAVVGRAATGFIVQLVRNIADFLTGLFLGTDGSTQTSGITVNDPNQQNLTFTGLNPSRNYHWRVLAFNSDGISLALQHQTTRTAARTFQEWRQLHFPSDLFNELVSGSGADPDGDGHTNLLEFALGGNPNTPTGPLVTTGVSVDGYLTITFRRRAGSAELGYEVQFSNNLKQPWQTLTGAPTQVSEPDIEGMETVTYRDDVPVANAAARFLRVRVERFGGF